MYFLLKDNSTPTQNGHLTLKSQRGSGCPIPGITYWAWDSLWMTGKFSTPEASHTMWSGTGQQFLIVPSRQAALSPRHSWWKPRVRKLSEVFAFAIGIHENCPLMEVMDQNHLKELHNISVLNVLLISTKLWNNGLEICAFLFLMQGYYRYAFNRNIFDIQEILQFL